MQYTNHQKPYKVTILAAKNSQQHAHTYDLSKLLFYHNPDMTNQKYIKDASNPMHIIPYILIISF